MPYEAVAPAVPASPDAVPVVGTAPTLRSRNVHGTDFDKGIVTIGEKGIKLQPIQPVHAAARSVSMPYVQPSTVAPDAIKPSLFVTFNLYSPVNHTSARYEWSRRLPTPASLPLTKLPGVNHASRRPSAAPFTFPYPLTTADWPSASQWLADRMRDNQV